MSGWGCGPAACLRLLTSSGAVRQRLADAKRGAAPSAAQRAGTLVLCKGRCKKAHQNLFRPTSFPTLRDHRPGEEGEAQQAGGEDGGGAHQPRQNWNQAQGGGRVWGGVRVSVGVGVVMEWGVGGGACRCRSEGWGIEGLP